MAKKVSAATGQKQPDRATLNRLIRVQLNQDRGSQAWTKFLILIEDGRKDRLVLRLGNRLVGSRYWLGGFAFPIQLVAVGGKLDEPKTIRPLATATNYCVHPTPVDLKLLLANRLLAAKPNATNCDIP